MNAALFRHTVAANRFRLLACTVGLVVWGAVMPLIYASFGPTIKSFAEGNPLIQQFSQFGGGDIFTLGGMIAIGIIHPFTLILLGIFAVGYSTFAFAGERQRGTLEVLLTRPVSRRSAYVTYFAVGALFLGFLLAVMLAGTVVAAAAVGVLHELVLANVVLLWVNGWLLFVAFMAIGLAASVSFDRLGPALGLMLAFVLVNYLVDVIGSLWPDASWISDYTIFALIPAKHVLNKGLVPVDMAWLVGIVAVAVAYAWIVFPRRDLAAPS